MAELIYSKIYKRLEKLGILKLKQYMKLQSNGLMDLNVDHITSDSEEGSVTIAMAHNYVENGDVMADPDMEIKIFPKMEMAEALTFQQSNPPLYQRVYPEEGKVDTRLKKTLNQFLLEWLIRLEKQDFEIVRNE